MFVVNAAVAFVSLLTCIQTVLYFTTFTSTLSTTTALTVRIETPVYHEVLEAKERWELEKASMWHALMCVLWNLGLVFLFLLQHWLMASHWWKDLLLDLGVETVQRAIYILATCWVLQVMMGRYEPVQGSPLWYIDTNEHGLLWLLFFMVHVIAWLLLYGTCLVMDLPEMVGIKQVYYKYLDVDPPILHKSAPTRRLYGHMRHGGASCLLVILWVHPMMTLARLILATMLTFFTICGFTVYDADYVYLREQIARKRITLRVQRKKTFEIVQ